MITLNDIAQITANINYKVDYIYFTNPKDYIRITKRINFIKRLHKAAK